MNGETLKGMQILLVEDEYMIADDLAQELEQAGAAVLGPVATLGAANRVVETGARIDAAVLDVDLRGDKVWPLADRFLASRVPVIFVTGYDSRHVPEVYRHIPRYEKPVDPGRIVRALMKG